MTTALEKTFVPENLGFSHISREKALAEHSRQVYYKIFEEADRTKNFLVLDGTYVYVEKPGDFELQKKTFSGQKNRNLVKPFMVVFPDGYILDATSWFADGEELEF